MDSKINEILKYGVMAPSGDNSQPWRFEIQNDTVFVYNIPDKDNPYLNFMQSGTLIAHGALLKNIEIASHSFHLAPSIKLFPDFSNEDLVAQITFSEDPNTNPHPLFDFLSERATNRRPYKNIPFKNEHDSILKEAGVWEDLDLRFITERSKMDIAGKAGSSAEIIILENEMLHEYLFRDVMWTKKQEEKERHGLYIKTMEFNPIQKLLFKLASYKNIMKLAIKIHFPYFIAKQDAVLYASGSALGILTLKKVSKENFVKLGMKMEEVWLKATSLGLSFQLVTATLFLGFKLRNNPDDKELNQKHKDIAFQYYQDIFKVFDLEPNDVPLIMFRIGYAKAPSARSSRKEIKYKFI